MDRVRLLLSVLLLPGVVTSASAAETIPDGTFEAGTPWPAWTAQTSTQFGTPLCDLTGCGTQGGTAGPFAGNNWAWFGGSGTQPEASTLGQSVTLPRSPDVRLRFKLRIGGVTPPATDSLVVSIDGTPAATFAEPAVAEGAYSSREVNLTSFADGGTHALLFRYNHPDLGNSSFTVDDVELLVATCEPSISVVPDGRRATHTLAAGASQWFLSTLQIGASYSAECVNELQASGAPALAVFRGDDGCSATSTAETRDTRLLDAAASSAARVSFRAAGADPVYRLRVDNATGSPLVYALSISETTLYSAAWSSLGSYETYYSLQNTSSALVSGTLTLRDTTGAVVATGSLAIPPGRTVAANTVGLGVAADGTGTAAFSHDGPPGSILATAVIANFSSARPYVQVVRFAPARQAR